MVLATLLAPTVIGCLLVAFVSIAYYVRVDHIVLIHTPTQQIPVATFSSYEPFYGGDASQKAAMVAELISHHAP